MSALGFRRQRRERDARRGRLGQGTYQGLVTDLAQAIQLAFDSGATACLWGLEGPLRHAIRSDLCLQGWRWIEAEKMARELLADAFRCVNAVRPTWNEGQLEWTNEAGTLIERLHCARCHKPLPEERRKFCSDLCRENAYGAIATMKEASEDRAVAIAIRRI